MGKGPASDVAPGLVCRVIIPGEPVPKGRPRLGRGGSTYTPAKTAAAETEIGWRVKLALPSGYQPDGDHEFVLKARFELGNKRRRDLDNLVKLVMDAFNDVVWVDDSQVAEVHATLERGCSVPRAIVEIYRR